MEMARFNFVIVAPALTPRLKFQRALYPNVVSRQSLAVQTEPLNRKSHTAREINMHLAGGTKLSSDSSVDSIAYNDKNRPAAVFESRLIFLKEIGAGEGIRTLDPNLGKVVL
jgi:hypothetical protein